MVNILLEGYDIQAPWLYDELKNYIKPTHKISVVAFSFRDSRVKSLLDWNVLYGEDNGIIIGYSAGAVIQLSEYHLSPDEDYPEFKYYKGLTSLKTEKGGFEIEKSTPALYDSAHISPKRHMPLGDILYPHPQKINKL